VRRLDRALRGSQTEEIAEMNLVIQWLAETMPVSGPATILHNDYKLDNVMLNAQGRIEAVLDGRWPRWVIHWPNLGLTLCSGLWVSSSGRNDSQAGSQREQLVERYASKTGRDVSRIAFYEVLEFSNSPSSCSKFTTGM